MENIEKDYNTRRSEIVIPEYGRNVQTMVEFALTVEDKDERNKVAKAIIHVMGQLNPHLRDVSDFNHKLWDHLFIISDFKLDVDSPYPIPKPQEIFAKPESMGYPQRKIRKKNYGSIIDQMIQVAIDLDDEAAKKEIIESILNSMKRLYIKWSNSSVEDTLIKSDFKALSRGKLEIDEDFILASSQSLMTKSRSNNNNNNKHKKYNNKNKNYKYKKR